MAAASTSGNDEVLKTQQVESEEMTKLTSHSTLSVSDSRKRIQKNADDGSSCSGSSNEQCVSQSESQDGASSTRAIKGSISESLADQVCLQ